MRAASVAREANRAFIQFCENGDPAAITHVFDLTAPTLLTLASHLTRDRAIAEDLVQATFLDAIEHAARFDRTRPVLPWLTGMLINHVRHERRRAGRSLDPGRIHARATPDTPAETAQAREFASIVADALDQLPEVYREVLTLRLVQGLEPSQIAEHLQRPRDTVKTQLARGLSRLRRLLPRGVAPALAIAFAGGASAGKARAAVQEAAHALAPTTAPPLAAARPRWQLWIAAGAAVTATGVLSWLAMGGGTESIDSTGRVASEPARAIRPDSTAGTTPPSARATDEQRTELSTNGHPITVQVLYHDGSPAAGVTVSLRPAGDRSWLRERRAHTDANGTVQFAAEAGIETWQVRSDRGEPATLVPAGRAEPTAITVPEGIDVSGIVLGPEGEPIAGARLWLAPPSIPADEGAVIGTTDPDGRFALQDLPPGAALGALANGLSSARCAVLRDTSVENLLLKCRSRAPVLRGVVRTPEGEPVADAAVLVGRVIKVGRSKQLAATSRLRTAADGSFVCSDQRSLTEIPVWAVAPGYAAARVITEKLRGGEERALELRLQHGAEVTGTIVEADGSAVDDVFVTVHQSSLEPLPWEDFPGPGWGRLHTVTAADGTFAIADVLPGEVELFAVARSGARARAQRSLAVGERAEWSPVLGRGGRLRARLIDPAGAGLAQWTVLVEALDEGTIGQWVTDEHGLFTVEQCEEGQRYRLRLHQSDSLVKGSWATHDVVARDEETYSLEIPSRHIARGSVALTLARPDGAPVEKIMILLAQLDGESGPAQGRWAGVAEGGRYEIGPLTVGRYQLMAWDRELGPLGLGAVTTSGEGTTNFGTHRFETPGVLRLRMKAWDGTPLPADLTVRSEALPVGLAFRLTGGAGELNVQPGAYTVHYAGPHGALWSLTSEVAPGATIEHDVQLEPGQLHRVQFEGDPAPASLFELTWFRDGEVILREEVRINVSPEPRSIRLLPGDYRLVVRDTSSGHEAETHFVVAGGDAEVELVVRAPQ